MFNIQLVQQDGFDMVRLSDGEWEYEATEIDIIPSHGALLHAFRVPYGSSSQLNVIDSYKDTADLRTNFTETFKSVKLSPFACRIPDGKYEWEGQALQIQRKAVPGVCLHGLLYNAAFSISSQYVDERQAVLTLRYSYTGEDIGYPFPYDCEVKYRLLPEQVLEIQTTIINKSATTLPVMDGWHPYFTTGSPVDELELQFFSRELVVFNEQLVPSGEFLPYTEFVHARKIGALSLDNSFLLDTTIKHQPACVLYDPLKSVRISLWPDETYPILQLYIPPQRQSIAIENLSGAPNAFNNGIGLVQIAPGDATTFSTKIEVHAIAGDYFV